jgi:murein DD-endopeptidase MepM/ murein hydrolase activator NlpD
MSGDINGGRLYLTDGKTLFITALSPHATTAVDCPAVPFPPPALFDQPELAMMDMQLPVSTTLPSDLSHYPGGRWPEFGYGVLDGLILSDVPYSDTVRAVAPGTISRIVVDPAPLLEADLIVISNTRRIPAAVGETLWGNQVWIDHGNGIQTRYGGFGILPSVQEGQTVHRLAILGYAGDRPVLFGLWANEVYLGYARSMPETVTGYRALFDAD